MQTQGREIGEIKKKLDDVSTNVTAMTTILPHLVTKEHCAEARNDTMRQMKDRMDGKSELTGMNITLPELWDKAAKYASDEEKQPKPPPERGARYWITLTAAIISLLGCLIGMTTFVVKTLQRQDRTDEILRTFERSLQQQQDHRGGAPAQPQPASSTP